MKKYLVICVISIGLLACEKDAGEGGTSIIDGRVIYFTTSYNTLTSVNDTHYYPKAGKDVVTTINIDMQDVAEKSLERTLINENAEWGCVVLMEVATGKVKVIAIRLPATPQSAAFMPKVAA